MEQLASSLKHHRHHESPGHRSIDDDEEDIDEMVDVDDEDDEEEVVKTTKTVVSSQTSVIKNKKPSDDEDVDSEDEIDDDDDEVNNKSSDNDMMDTAAPPVVPIPSNRNRNHVKNNFSIESARVNMFAPAIMPPPTLSLSTASPLGSSSVTSSQVSGLPQSPSPALTLPASIQAATAFSHDDFRKQLLFNSYFSYAAAAAAQQQAILNRRRFNHFDSKIFEFYIVVKILSQLRRFNKINRFRLHLYKYLA